MFDYVVSFFVKNKSDTGRRVLNVIAVVEVFELPSLILIGKARSAGSMVGEEGTKNSQRFNSTQRSSILVRSNAVFRQLKLALSRQITLEICHNGPRFLFSYQPIRLSVQ